MVVKGSVDVSVILPCRDEEESIGMCIGQIKEVFRQNNIKGEVIVSDSSVDKTPEIAKKLGAVVVKHDKVGYGKAYLEGFKVAKGKYIFMADCDGSYDFRNIPRFIAELKKGSDLVIGNRFLGKIEVGAMPFLHRYFGNPVLSGILRLFFNSKVRDAHSGMRAINRKSLEKLDLRTTGMEFASEMIILAGKNNLKVKELPINYYKRKGESKLESFSDGWRHLRFMLMYAPAYLFLIPGLFFLFFGLLIFEFLLFGYGKLIILGSFFTVLGYQIVATYLYAKAYMKSVGFIKSDKFLDFVAKTVKFETGLVYGGLFLLLSLFVGLFFTFVRGLDNTTILIVLTLSILGIQTIFSAFFLSIMLVEKK